MNKYKSKIAFSLEIGMFQSCSLTKGQGFHTIHLYSEIINFIFSVLFWYSVSELYRYVQKCCVRGSIGVFSYDESSEVFYCDVKLRILSIKCLLLSIKCLLYQSNVGYYEPNVLFYQSNVVFFQSNVVFYQSNVFFYQNFMSAIVNLMSAIVNLI